MIAMKFDARLVIVLCCMTVVASFIPTRICSAKEAWTGIYRGVNATELTENDVRELSEWKVNIIRLSFNKRPLMKKDPPFDIDIRVVAYLDNVLSWAERYGIRVVIDPHTSPGTEVSTTTKAKDAIWRDGVYQDALVYLWVYLAKRYADRGSVIAGYDLLNEPNVPRDLNGHPVPGLGDWNALVNRLVNAIRKHDQVHTIVVEPITSRRQGKRRIYPMDGDAYFVPPKDSNIVYSPHFYEPGAFSHQQINAWNPDPVNYPGIIAGEYWDKNRLREVMKPIFDVQKKYNIPVFIGEFSAPRWTGDSGNRYLRDLMELYEEFGWSWAYHIFRGADAWDAEKSNFSREDHKFIGKETDRAIMLREFFSKNGKEF